MFKTCIIHANSKKKIPRNPGIGNSLSQGKRGYNPMVTLSKQSNTVDWKYSWARPADEGVNFLIHHLNGNIFYKATWSTPFIFHEFYLPDFKMPNVPVNSALIFMGFWDGFDSCQLEKWFHQERIWLMISGTHIKSCSHSHMHSILKVFLYSYILWKLYRCKILYVTDIFKSYLDIYLVFQKILTPDI